MKRILLVLVCVAVVAGIGLGIYSIKKKDQLAVEDILPSEALLYVQFNDVERNLRDLTAMPFWQGVQAINYDKLVERKILDTRGRMFIQLIKEQLNAVLDHPLSKKIFGREVTLAVYVPDALADLAGLGINDTQQLSVKMFEQFLSKFILITRVDPEVQLAEVTSRLFGQFGANVTQTQVDHNGENIHIVTLNNTGIQFGITRLKDLLIIGIGDTAAKTSIEIYRGQGPSLRKDPQFDQARKKYPASPGMIGYYDFAEFVRLLKSQGERLITADNAAAEQPAVRGQWQKFLSQVAGLNTFGFSATLKPVIKLDSYFLFDQAKLDPEFAPLYTCPSSENQTIRLIPKDVLAYQWSNCFKLDYYWRQMNQELEQAGNRENNIEQIETGLGLNVEKDLLPAFGEEIGGYLKDFDLGGIFPIPQILFFISVQDQGKTQSLLDGLKNYPMVLFQEENYNGINIKYLNLPLGQNLQPAYCFIEHYLLVAMNRQLLKDSIDAAQDRADSLLSSGLFKDVNYGLTAKNRSVQFIKVGASVDRVKEVLKWGNQWVVNRDKSSQAFIAGSQRPVDEVDARIAELEEEANGLRDQIIVIEDEIWNMENKNLDISAQREEFKRLKIQLDAKREEIASEVERREELSVIVQDIEESTLDPEKRQAYLEEIIYPILDGLKSIEVLGGRSAITSDSFESTMILKVLK